MTAYMLHVFVFDTAPGPSTVSDDLHDLVQSCKKLFLKTWATCASCSKMLHIAQIAMSLWDITHHEIAYFRERHVQNGEENVQFECSC